MIVQVANHMQMRIVTAMALLVASACKGPPAHVDGPPARLVAGFNDTVVVNEYLAARLPVHVLDSAGHDVRADGVRYRQTSGDPIALSALGIVKCARSADADVRVTLGGLAVNLHVLCRPVYDLRTMGGAELVIGDSAKELSFVALGPDSQVVAPLAGTVVIDDANIASVKGLRVRARAPGMTEAHVRIGNFSRGVMLTTYERVSSLEGLRPSQRNVLVPVRLARGEVRRWRIPPGFYLITMSRNPNAAAGPMLDFSGVRCERFLGIGSFLCRASSDMTVIAYQPLNGQSEAEVSGQIAMRRIEP